MASDAFIQCRVASATKAALRAAADRQLLTESAMLKRMLDLMLNAAGPPESGSLATPKRSTRRTRLYVRLTTGDRQLLDARAAARHLASATYSSNLLRAHLRSLTPLPHSELRAIRDATRELSVIGRNLNAIALAANKGVPGVSLSIDRLADLLKVCVALRDHFRAYVRTNAASWESRDGIPKP